MIRPRWLVAPLTAVAGLGIVVVTTTRCSVYTPDLLDGSEGGVEAGCGVGWGSRARDGGCFSAGVPVENNRPRPTGGDDLPPITLAIKTMRLGGVDPQGEENAHAWEDIGFDLDNTCTSSTTCPPSQTDPAFSCAQTGSSVPVDGNYCRDNTFGRLQVIAQKVSTLAQKYGLNDEAFNCSLCIGAYNFLIKISGYNGQSDDDTVRVDLYPSPGLASGPLPWDCSQPSWHDNPCFSPDQPFTVEDDVVAEKRGGPDLPASILFDDAAYVREGYLVMQLPEDTLFWFPGTNKAPAKAFPLVVKQGVVTGKIHRAKDLTWVVDDGIIAGRSLETDVVRGFRLIGFCENDDAYPVMTEFLHTNVDILGSGENDPAKPCDAISVGIGYTAVQATAGKLVHVDPPVECAGLNLDGGIKDAGGGG